MCYYYVYVINNYTLIALQLFIAIQWIGRNIVNLLQLWYFKCLAQMQHVSKTAEDLHISQPSLSSTIKRLENELGCELFEHKGRNIQLSKYGYLFLKRVNNVFLEIEQGKQELQRTMNQDSNNLSIAMLSPYIWKKMTYSFTEKYPLMKINQQSQEEFDFVPHLISGAVDFYIGATNNINDPRIDSMNLYHDKMVIMLNKTHSLANQKNINLSLCKDEKFVMLPEAASLQNFIEYLCAKSGFTPVVALECDYTLREEMVAMGYGISITTLYSAKLNKNPDLTYVVIDNPSDRRILSLAWNNALPFTKAMHIFYQYLIHYYDL